MHVCECTCVSVCVSACVCVAVHLSVPLGCQANDHPSLHPVLSLYVMVCGCFPAWVQPVRLLINVLKLLAPCLGLPAWLFFLVSPPPAKFSPHTFLILLCTF